MKKVLIFMVLFISCSSVSKIKTDNTIKKESIDMKVCNENLTFKKAFFSNIENVENLETKEQNESFHKSLLFISKYTHVSFEEMRNYARIYDIGVLKRDKQVWLQWYEENKCDNIQFKE